ncbi:MAG: preprotein translocase subunit SecG, partial [Pseudomonadota bacterium]|nr:preprotein translocase subunit SecG [Pseudomonadota bacterium]
ALVGIILLQRSEGGGLGIGSGTMGGLMTARASGNLLTRTTAILATCFMLTSITLAIMAGGHRKAGQTDLQSLIEQTETAPAATSPVAPSDTAAPAEPAPPAEQAEQPRAE